MSGQEKGQGGAAPPPSRDLDPAAAFGLVGVHSEPMRALAVVASDRPSLGRGMREPAWLDMAGADLGRLNSGFAPVLADHCNSLDALLGVVERAWCDDRSLYAALRFAPTPRGTEAFGMVKAGVLRHCSIGFHGLREVEPGSTGAHRMAYWMPYEISLVAIPADWTTRVQAGPTPPRIVDALAREAAESVLSEGARWSAWARRAAERLARVPAEDLAATLSDAIDGELADRAAQAAESARRRLAAC